MVRQWTPNPCTLYNAGSSPVSPAKKIMGLHYHFVCDNKKCQIGVTMKVAGRNNPFRMVETADWLVVPDGKDAKTYCDKCKPKKLKGEIE